MVGPFIFIDHMGPAALKSYENLDVGPHPHIGLSTLTYLFEGSIVHKDSLGTEMEIKPGAVNWMTAGKGVTHSERTPEYLRATDKSLHGLQIWVALPLHLENGEPSFQHIEAKDIPEWQTENGLHMKLIAGEAFGKKSPVAVYSKLYFIEIKSTVATTVKIGQELFGESGLYIMEGSVSENGNVYEPKQFLVAKDARLCEFDIAANSTIYLFGGEAFPEERFILWNFVSSSKATLETAKQDWINHKFPEVPGDPDYVPLPDFYLDKPKR